MDITYYHTIDDTLQILQDEVSPEEWKGKVTWVNIRSTNRKEVADYFDKYALLKGGRDYILHPENYSLAKTFGESTVLNLVVSNAENIYSPDYITVIIEKDIALTIVPESSKLLNEKKLSVYSEMKFTDIANYLFYILISDILLQSNNNLGIARNRINRSEDMLVNDPGKISPKEIICFEQDISQLADIIEDQYVGFGILSSLSTKKSSLDNIKYRKELVKGFDPINKSMTRLEEKAESLRLQYMLTQQAKSTKKINFLTIVQAVFVPLTFIAGVYGMNFENMPELGWKYGYTAVWAVFIVMASASLSYFYKNGWFD